MIKQAGGRPVDASCERVVLTAACKNFSLYKGRPNHHQHWDKENLGDGLSSAQKDGAGHLLKGWEGFLVEVNYPTSGRRA